MNSYINREEIVNRLAKSLHPDNLGVINFYDESSKDKIKDLNIEIYELGKEKVNTASLVGIKESAPKDLFTEYKKSTIIKLNDGGYCFEVKPDKDYQISVKQGGFPQNQYKVNWRELILNKEVGLLIKKLDCKTLAGTITSKNVLLEMTNLQLRLIDKETKKETSLDLSASGAFGLLSECNKSYILEIFENNIKKHSIELTSFKKDQSFKDVVYNGKDFDFLLQEANSNRVIIPTSLLTNQDLTMINFNQNDLLVHFLNHQEFDIHKGMVFQLTNYSFDYGKLEFSESSKKEFDLLNQLLNLYPGMKVSINVHTDAAGSVSYSQRFTYDIAEKISRYLTNRGIDKARILSRGMGKSFPLENSDKDNSLRNRRVEVEILEF
ncbi:MAG TPA: OmpA family protein [Saprospiraceae bacterium]|nr:OmpA family protein [Saprospiraceae bacterium]